MSFSTPPPSVFSLIHPTAAPLPPPAALVLSFFIYPARPQCHLSFCFYFFACIFQPADLILSLIFPLSPSDLVASTPPTSNPIPLSHDRTKSGNQMTSFSHFTCSQSLRYERKLCPPPKPFIASGGTSCVVHTGKDFGVTGIFGALGKIWGSWSLKFLPDIFSHRAYVIRVRNHMILIKRQI